MFHCLSEHPLFLLVKVRCCCWDLLHYEDLVLGFFPFELCQRRSILLDVSVVSIISGRYCLVLFLALHFHFKIYWLDLRFDFIFILCFVAEYLHWNNHLQLNCLKRYQLISCYHHLFISPENIKKSVVVYLFSLGVRKILKR